MVHVYPTLVSITLMKPKCISESFNGWYVTEHD